MRKPYAPQPGTIPAKVVAWLAAHPGEHATAVIAEGIGVAPEGLGATLAPALKHGVIGQARREGRVYFWHQEQAPQEQDDDEDDAPMVHRLVSVKPAARWAVWSDGSVVIEQGRQRVELKRDDVRKLIVLAEKAQEAVL